MSYYVPIFFTKLKKSTDEINSKTREMIKFNPYLNHRNIYNFLYTTQDIYRRLSPHKKIQELVVVIICE